MKREKEILQILLKKEKPVTIREVATIVGVSEKTIRTDLKKMEGLTKEYNLKLIKKTGVGVSIEGNGKDKINLLNYLETTNQKVEDHSSEYRKDVLLTKLFFKSIKNVQEICDNLFVSRSSVYKDLKEIETWLTKYSLKLDKDKEKGLSIEGEEKNYRNAFVEFLLDFDEKIGKDEKGDFRKRSKKIKNLKRIMDLEDYFKFEKIVYELEDQLEYEISEEAFNSFIYYIIIAIYRVNTRHYIDISKKEVLEVSHKREFELAETLCKRIDEDFNIDFPLEEKAYICLHILSFDEGNFIKEDYLNNISTKDKVLINTITTEITETIEKGLKIFNLEIDDKGSFLKGLYSHLVPTINRVRYGIVLKNPYLEEIKNNYSNYFGISWLTRDIFKKHLKTNFSEDEVGFLASYIGSIFERADNKIRTVVITPNNLGLSQLLLAKLEKYFGTLEIKDVISQKGKKEYDFKDIDLVITTVPLHRNLDVRNIMVKPLLLEEDQLKLKTLISSIQNQK